MKIVDILPDLNKEDRDDMLLEQENVMQTFKEVKNEFIQLLVFSNYSEKYSQAYSSNEEFLKSMKERSSLISNDFGRETIHILKHLKTNIDSWSTFFFQAGLPSKNLSDMINLFIEQTRILAKRPGYCKKYKSTIENFKLADEQVGEWIDRQKDLDLSNYIKEKKLEELSCDQWKELCFKRWPWMKEFIKSEYSGSFGPAEVAIEYDARESRSSGIFNITCDYDNFNTLYNNKYSVDTPPEKYYDSIKNYETGYSWQ